MSSKALERRLQNFLTTQTVEAAIFYVYVVRIHSKNVSHGRFEQTTMEATTALANAMA